MRNAACPTTGPRSRLDKINTSVYAFILCSNVLYIYIYIYIQNIKPTFRHIHSSLLLPFLKDWFKLGQEYIKEALNLKNNNNIAKNVIFFIGDGMGASTVTAARIYKGQKAGNPGEETVLSFERFPNVALSKVKLHTF